MNAEGCAGFSVGLVESSSSFKFLLGYLVHEGLTWLISRSYRRFGPSQLGEAASNIPPE